MAFDEKLSDRISEVLRSKKIKFETKKMFGGICFLIKEKMCVGVVGEKLMARIDPEIYEDSLKRKGCEEMNFSGKPMKGFVFINEEGTKAMKDLKYWIEKALEFNPKAKKSKK